MFIIEQLTVPNSWLDPQAYDHSLTLQIIDDQLDIIILGTSESSPLIVTCINAPVAIVSQRYAQYAGGFFLKFVPLKSCTKYK